MCQLYYRTVGDICKITCVAFAINEFTFFLPHCLTVQVSAHASLDSSLVPHIRMISIINSIPVVCPPLLLNLFINLCIRLLWQQCKHLQLGVCTSDVVWSAMGMLELYQLTCMLVFAQSCSRISHDKKDDRYCEQTLNRRVPYVGRFRLC